MDLKIANQTKKDENDLHDKLEQALTAESNLRDKLEQVLINAGLSYKSSMWALGTLYDNYKHKGSHLLDSANIKQVAKEKRFKTED